MLIALPLFKHLPVRRVATGVHFNAFTSGFFCNAFRDCFNSVYLWDNRVGEVENGRSYGEDLEEGE